MNTSDILNKAADLIEERGWTRGGGWNNDDERPLCLEGGILAAMGYTFSDVDLNQFFQCPAYEAVQRYLNLSTTVETGDLDLVKPENPLWGWNDWVAPGAEQVIEVLRATALVEAARETQPAEVSL